MEHFGESGDQDGQDLWPSLRTGGSCVRLGMASSVESPICLRQGLVAASLAEPESCKIFHLTEAKNIDQNSETKYKSRRLARVRCCWVNHWLYSQT